MQGANYPDTGGANSRFKSGKIDGFRQQVEGNGGRFIDHISMRRGRVYQQMSGEHLRERSWEIVDGKMLEWLKPD